MTDEARRAEFPEEALALDRLIQIAKHHGWSPYDTLWRVMNGLLHERPPFDVARFLWGLDFVASSETDGTDGFRPMLDSRLPKDRDDDPLLEAQRQYSARGAAVLQLTKEVLREADGPLTGEEIRERTRSKLRAKHH